MSGRYEVVTTSGGARAMRDAVVGEVMHPGVGPAAEAEELYVAQSRLRERLRGDAAVGGDAAVDGERELDPSGERENAKTLVLFDVGLGAASNALAARRASESLAGDARAKRLELVSFEKDTGSLELALLPENAASFGLSGEAGLAACALLADGQHESARTHWWLRRGDLLGALAREELRADVVFWDPFSPLANPELWTVRAFAALRARCGPRCTLFTYSSATSVRSALLLAGFAVGIGAGIGLKGETTAAAVGVGDLERPLTRRFVERLTRSSAPFPADAPPDALVRIGALPQFQD